jgi:predicted Zn-dependent peptidase
MLEELQIDRSNPEFLASVALHRELYPGHPYGIVAPTEESIARITARKLAALHERLFIPENALMVVAGDIGEDKLKRLLEAGFGSWKTGGSPLEPLPAPEQPRGRGQVAVVDRPGSEQAVLLLGVPAVPRDHPDYFPLLVANQILGGSFGARLNMDLRERRGLTYGAYSSLETARSAGALLVDTQVPNKAVGKALKGIEKHLERLRKEPPTAEELARAKNMLAGSFARHLETQAGVADAVADALLDGLPGNYLDDYLERVDAVSAQDVLRAASARLPPGGAVIAVVGDAAKLRLDGAPRISPPARKI